MTNDREPILRLDRVSLKATLGSTYLVQDMTFTVARGEKVAVVGASGAGKTSLLRLLDRLSTPDRGTIYLEEIAYDRIPIIQLRRQVVLMTQEPKLLGMSVKDALAYPLQLQQLPAIDIRQRVATITEQLLIPETWLDKTELQLSLGQRQLVAIARSLVMKPKVLLLDEPLSALDFGTSAHLLTVLDRLAVEQSMTVIMVNHQLSAMTDFVDRILYLKAGRLASEKIATSANWQDLQQELLEAKTNSELDWD
jgi:D-methionine transport system ATP-binding protein